MLELFISEHRSEACLRSDFISSLLQPPSCIFARWRCIDALFLNLLQLFGSIGPNFWDRWDHLRQGPGKNSLRKNFAQMGTTCLYLQLKFIFAVQTEKPNMLTVF